jgi:Phage QLRG family, putative DNA packaging.
MPYTTLEKIKRRLGITTADHDTLLSDLLNEVDAEINLILSRHVTVPVRKPEWLPILDGIEADWVAGRYRMLIEPAALITPEGEMREHVFVTDAKKRLRQFLEAISSVVVSKL